MEIEVNRLIVGPIQTNCYIVRQKGSASCFVVDPGANDAKVLGKLHGMEAVLEAILITHWHPDHIGAAGELRQLTGARIIIGENDAAGLNGTKDRFGMLADRPEGFRSADITLTDGQEETFAGIRVRAIETPGHTSGGMCYLLCDHATLFSGDTLFFASIGRTDLEGGSFEAIKDSITTKLFALEDNVRVLPGHGPETSIGREKSRVTALLNGF